MKLLHRRIDIARDREYVLERHCRINYECESPWKRAMPYAEYREEWFSMKGQIDGFLGYLEKTAVDEGAIAEIIDDEFGQRVGYLWVPFHSNEESGFRFAEIQDIYVEEAFRQQGIAGELFAYAQARAKENGATVIRSGTGCENKKSIKLHEKLGFYKYRYEFEKLL